MKVTERKIRKALSAGGVTDSTITSRIKSVYSTHIKMREKKYSLNQVQDVIALRVLVSNIKTAYSALGILHAHWRPLPGTFKDYISFPKPNGYQALHTRVIIDKHIFEVQILTHEMHQQAQLGIAAHFHYKEKRHGNRGIDMQWFDKLLSRKSARRVSWSGYSSSATPDESLFVKDMQTDFLQERMFIYTPKGDVIDLPREATVADFAFAIHSDIGLHAEGALVNGKYVSIKQKLKNGDVVNVKTNKKTTVTEKWLDWVKTTEARTRVRQNMKKQQEIKVKSS